MKSVNRLFTIFLISVMLIDPSYAHPSACDRSISFPTNTQAITPRADVFTGNSLTQESALRLGRNLQIVIGRMNNKKLDRLLEDPQLTRKYLGTDLMADFEYFVEHGWVFGGRRTRDIGLFLRRYLSAAIAIESGSPPRWKAEDLLRFRTFFLATMGPRKWVLRGDPMEDHIFPDVMAPNEEIRIKPTPWLQQNSENNLGSRKMFAAMNIGARGYLVYKNLKNGAWYRAEGVLDDDSGHLKFLETYSPTAVRASPLVEDKLNQFFAWAFGQHYTNIGLLTLFRHAGFCVRAALNYYHARLMKDRWDILGAADVNRYSNVPVKTDKFPTVQEIAARVRADERSRSFDNLFLFRGAA